MSPFAFIEGGQRVLVWARGRQAARLDEQPRPQQRRRPEPGPQPRRLATVNVATNRALAAASRSGGTMAGRSAAAGQ
ncbi:hypothetical protein ACTWPT_57115 [Nonomuraea sp. 3N208]|uniref:hypothetical protein n=1 Tax=Nonomuraea sp. 3N208 TaxID=3457421 RepID=UPI003FD5DB0C